MTDHIVWDMNLSSDGPGATKVTEKGDEFIVDMNTYFELPAKARNVKLSMTRADIVYSTPNITVANNRLRIIAPDNSVAQVIRTYDVEVPPGTYDFFSLKDIILSFLAAPPDNIPPAKSNPLPVISLDAALATGKVILTLNYSTVVVDFNHFPNNFAVALGFLPTDVIQFPVIGPPSGVYVVESPNRALFDTIRAYLIHTDLVGDGVTVNGFNEQILSFVSITGDPGQAFTFEPQHPSTSRGDHLIGTRRSTIRCWITDERNQSIDMLSDPWSFNLRIEYFL